jgi:hypothetical protein
MARFAQGFRTTATSNTVFEIIGAANARVRLVEMGLTLTGATLTPVGLGYAAAQGITPTTPVTMLTESDNSTTTITTALAWATPPTIPTYFYRRASLPVGLGYPIVWTWPVGDGLVLTSGTSLVLWLFAAGSTIDGWVAVEE